VALHGITVGLICLFTVLGESQSHNVGITLHGSALVKIGVNYIWQGVWARLCWLKASHVYLSD